MAHTITFDLRKGTGVPEAFLMGSVEIEPTAMHTSGTALVFPAPIAVPITDGTASVSLDPSPAGDNPAWAYRIVIRETKTKRAWSEIVRVPDVAGPTAYTALERLTTGPSAPPLTTWGEIVAEAAASATAAEESAASAAASAALVGAPAGTVVRTTVEGDLDNPASGIATRLNAAIGQKNAEQVPPLVAEAIAADSAPAAAAAAAVADVMGSLPTNVRTNGILNPSVNADTNGWIHWAGVSGVATGARVAVGSRWAYETTWTTQPTGTAGCGAGPGRFNVPIVPVTPGVTDTFTGKAWVSKLQRVRLTITYYNAGGTQVGSTIYGVSRRLEAGAEEEFSVTNTHPAGVTHARLEIDCILGHADSTPWGNDGTGKLRVRDFTNAAGAYFDGDSPASTWAGVRGNSTSTIAQLDFDQANADLLNNGSTKTAAASTAKWLTRHELAGSLRTNRVTNPDCAVDATGWSKYDGSGGVATGGRIVRTYADGRQKSGYLVTWSTATNSPDGYITCGRTTSDDVPVTAGQKITFAAEAIPSITQRLGLSILFRDAAGAAVGLQLFGPSRSIAAGEEVDNLLTYTVTVPATATRALVRVIAVSTGVVWPAGATLFATNVTYEEGDYGRRGFSGDDPGCAWLGVRGASASTTFNRGMASSHSPRLTGIPTLNRPENVLQGWVDTDQANTRPAADLAATLLADAFKRSSWPVRTTLLPAGHDLTVELGAGWTEHGFATAPVRWTSLVPGTLDIGGRTYRSNVATGTGGTRTPYGFESIASATTTASMIVRYRNNQGGGTQAPSVGVYIDGELAGGGWVRDPGTDSNGLLAYKVTGIPAGSHVLHVEMKNSDVFSIVTSAGLSLSPTIEPAVRVGITGNSWIEHSDVWGGAWHNSIASILRRTLGVEMIYLGQGGTGYTVGARTFGSTARLDAIQAANVDYLIAFGAQNDASTASAVQAAAAAFLSEVATRSPNTKVILVGPESLGWEQATSFVTMTEGLKTSAAAAPNVLGGYVITPHLERWLTTDMAKWAIATDLIHPTPQGGRYYARRILEEIIRLFERTQTPLPVNDGWALG